MEVVYKNTQLHVEEEEEEEEMSDAEKKCLTFQWSYRTAGVEGGEARFNKA